MAAVREVLRSADATVPIDIAPLQQDFFEGLAPKIFITTLVLAFSSFALVLAAVGIWGVVAYAVSSRTREIGLRLALGAGPRQVVAESMRRGIGWSLVGMVVGAGAAFGLTRLVASQLWGVSPTDPLTFVGVTAALLLVTLAASYLPARRAAKVDPMVALRWE